MTSKIEHLLFVYNQTGDISDSNDISSTNKVSVFRDIRKI